VLTASALALAGSASAAAGRPVVYEGRTGQHEGVRLKVAENRRLDFAIRLVQRCDSGRTAFGRLETEPTDHFRVNPRRRFRVEATIRGRFRGGNRLRGVSHFQFSGRIGSRRARGVSRYVTTVLDRSGAAIDVCSSRRVHWRARRR
jgi:hypothetical protein